MLKTLLGLAVLAADIIAIVDCVKSDRDNLAKVLWIVLIVVLPFIGVLAYFIVGKKS